MEVILRRHQETHTHTHLGLIHFSCGLGVSVTRCCSKRKSGWVSKKKSPGDAEGFISSFASQKSFTLQQYKRQQIEIRKRKTRPSSFVKIINKNANRDQVTHADIHICGLMSTSEIDSYSCGKIPCIPLVLKFQNAVKSFSPVAVPWKA